VARGWFLFFLWVVIKNVSQALSCFISSVLVHQRWRLEFSSVAPKKDCFMIISTNHRRSSWPDVRIRSNVSSGQSFRYMVQLKIDKSGTKWSHKYSNKWEDRENIKSKLKYGTILIILKSSLLTVSPRQRRQKCLLVFVKPTEILWWIIRKRTDTMSTSPEKRDLNIESTGRKVERMVCVKD
jgi:hypothetical protein